MLEHPCVDCGEGDPIVLEFDHITDDKTSGISDLVGTGVSLDILIAEIAKCVVRCANCHRRKTSRELGWFRTIYQNKLKETYEGEEENLAAHEKLRWENEQDERKGLIENKRTLINSDPEIQLKKSRAMQKLYAEGFVNPNKGKSIPIAAENGRKSAQKQSLTVTGRRRSYREDGSWYWSYPNETKD